MAQLTLFSLANLFCTCLLQLCFILQIVFHTLCTFQVYLQYYKVVIDFEAAILLFDKLCSGKLIDSVHQHIPQATSPIQIETALTAAKRSQSSH